ncbi:MAG: 3'-5' exonuclease, partial [Gammaproteobacteria bacterium]
AEGKGEPLRVFDAATDLDEARFIVDETKALNRDGVVLSQIAVLYRSNAQSRVLEHALFAAGVSYRVYGGLRFFERQEIKHALAYLRLVANPDDDGALLRVINFPTRGVGSRTLEQLADAAKAGNVSLWQAARERAEGATRKTGDASLTARGVDGFVALIESMRAATDGLPLPEIVAHVVEASGLKAHYQKEREGADRVANLDELVNAAAGFTGEGEDGVIDLNTFLAHAALEAGEHQAQVGADALQLMTVHSAKGLEFHSVFLSGLEEGLFPHENSVNEDGGLEEERRLMYVAVTRARRRLYLSFAQSRMLHGQTRYNVASRFVHELPQQLLKLVGRRPAPYVAAIGGGGPRGGSQQKIAPQPSFGGWAAQSDTRWRIGQNVVHPKFGTGVIVGTEGRGSDARVQVNFRSGGLKWLMLEYAKLSAA